MARPPAKKAAVRKRKASASRKGTTTPNAKSSARKAAPPVRRPPEVSAADWKKWSAAYRKRAASFYRNNPGAPRYRMRGKQAGESLSRRVRLEARIVALAERQHYRGQLYGARSAADIAASYRAVVRDLGEGAFGKLERQINVNHTRWTDAGRPRTGDKTSLGLSPDDYLPDDFDWSDYGGEDSEFFYH